jgi:hypothetical protein
MKLLICHTMRFQIDQCTYCTKLVQFRIILTLILLIGAIYDIFKLVYVTYYLPSSGVDISYTLMKEDAPIPGGPPKFYFARQCV